jgi:hypothetical protein
MSESIKINGLKEFKAAVARNPQMVLGEVKNFLVRGLAVYKAGIIRNPWRVGGSGGGAPVSNDTRYSRKYQRQRSGSLRDSHVTEIKGLVGTIGPDTAVAPYAAYVHGVEGFPRKRAYQLRPWLDYVKEAKDKDIEVLYLKMLDNVTADLAK